MTAEELLAHVESLGITIAVEDGRVRVNAPRGSLTEEIKAALSEAKPELLTLLTRRAEARAAGVTRVSREAPLRLSSFQERVWVAQRMDPGSSAYNVVTVFQNSPGADSERVVAAIASLIERHEILRSSFEEVDGVLVARPLSPQSVSVQVRDLTELSEAQRPEAVLAEAERETREIFDLTAGPAVRFTVFRASGAGTATLLAAHHIAVDDWTIALIERELAEVCAPGAVAKPAPHLQYADYAAWQRLTQDPQVIAADLQWWDQYLAGAPQLSMFPPDRAGAVPAGARYTAVWSPELAAGLRTLARKEGATVYGALLAACATVLRWHTGQEDFVLGSPMGVREHTELENMLGPFVNLLLIRVDLAGNPTFAELLRRTRDSVLEAHAHRAVPFETLLERLKPPRNPGLSPLFQTAIVQHNASAAESGRMSYGGGAMHELTWFARETGAGLECTFEYRADLYSDAAIERIAAHLEGVLTRVVQDSARRLSELSVLPPSERTRIDGFNATTVQWEPGTFVEHFERRASQSSAATALVHAGVSMSYEELNRRANQLAHRLLEAGVRRGTHVALCLERSPSLLIALLAVQKAGGVYVPLDPGFPSERLSFMLEDCGASVLLTGGEVPDGLTVPASATVLDLADVAGLSAQPQDNPSSRAEPGDAAYLIYTSGSTGRPKGVALSHGALMNFLFSMARQPGLTERDVLAAVTTISFDIAGLELYLPLLVGARIELLERETAADGPALTAALSERGVTVLQATPATWRLLVDSGWQGGNGLRGFCGGEALAPDLAAALLERCAELWNLYGPTETTIWSTAGRVEHSQEITIGGPIANTRIHIVGTGGELQPIGVAGEILIGGAGVAIGYHQRPELTAERFLADPYVPGEQARMYRTGDLGRWRADGRLEHLGRIDNQVKIRGFRIELGEIESVLATLPAIRQAVVVARDAGPSDRRLVAYIVYHPGEDLTVSDVRRHLRGQLPDYMIPSLVVAVEVMPLTPNGKIDRAALPDPFRASAVATSAYEPPSSPMEQLLAEVWAEVLKVERVGVHDNFFELGGHSLLSVRVAAAVQARSGWRMDPRTLFFQTLGQLAGAGTVARERADAGA